MKSTKYQVRKCKETCFLKSECEAFAPDQECKQFIEFHEWIDNKIDFGGMKELLIKKIHDDSERFEWGKKFEQHQGDIIDAPTNDVGKQVLADLDLFLKFEQHEKKNHEKSISIEPIKIEEQQPQKQKAKVRL